MPAELPASYYLDNVRTLFRHVKTVYADILEAEHLDFLSTFEQLSDDAQKLIVRLFNRSGTLFRQGKLDYSEIQSIRLATEELEDSGFVDTSPQVGQEEILSLFNKAEIIASHTSPDLLRGLNRASLEQYLIDKNDASFIDRLIDREVIIGILKQDIYQILQMIFFGNLNQSMTDFVLRDLGLYQYENYRIDSDSRPYQSTGEIQIHWLLHQLQAYLELIDPDDHQMLSDCFDSIPDCGDFPSRLSRKADRLKFGIARQLERIGELDRAMQRYRQCYLPPCRERQARVYHQQKNIESAMAICRQIIDDPIDDAEFQFACSFAGRLVRQHKLKPVAAIHAHRKYRPETIDLVLAQQPGVEQAVAEHYRQQPAQQCFYLENVLFNSVFGCLIWEAIFAPVEGAFYNPFQYRPADYYDFDFVEKRRAIFDRIWSSTTTNEDIRRRVADCWQHKQGIANPLVDWQHISLDIIELALQRIPHPHWMAIFERQLRDLRNNRSGFPDLIVFPPEQGYLLVEVKGPGDCLQKNQQRWMQYFADNRIPHLLARVSWDAA